MVFNRLNWYVLNCRFKMGLQAEKPKYNLVYAFVCNLHFLKKFQIEETNA